MANPKFLPVRAFLFDLDGTLIDSKLDLVMSVNAMLREMGRVELPTDTVASYVGHGAPQLIARMRARPIGKQDSEFFWKFMSSTSSMPRGPIREWKRD